MAQAALTFVLALVGALLITPQDSARAAAAASRLLPGLVQGGPTPLRTASAACLRWAESLIQAATPAGMLQALRSPSGCAAPPALVAAASAAGWG